MGLFKKSLSAQDALNLAAKSLENVAVDTMSTVLIKELCVQAESALSRIKRADMSACVRRATLADQALCDRIIANYKKQAELWRDRLNNSKMHKRICKKQDKWRYHGPDTPSSDGNRSRKIVMPSTPIFQDVSTKKTENPPLPTSERLMDTSQLVYSLRVLKIEEDPELAEQFFFPQRFEESVEGQWAKARSSLERDHLRSLASQIAREFINENLVEECMIAEVTCLAPILNRDDYRTLVSAYIGKITSSHLLPFPLIQGLPQLIQSAASLDFLQTDDLVKILRALSECLKMAYKQSPNEHQQSPNSQQSSSSRQPPSSQQSPSSLHSLVMAISRVLDAMTHTNVRGLDQIEVHRPLSDLLKKLRTNDDAYLVHHATYALQALKNIPDDESPWKNLLRQGGEMVGAAVGLGIAAYTMDIPEFVEKLQTLQASTEQIVEAVLLTYEAANLLLEGGQGLRESIKTAVSFQGKQPWYQELRLADVLIQNGDLAKFEILVLYNVYRTNPAFQWGICHRLGEIAANSLLLLKARESALNFLGEIFKNDSFWLGHPHIKQLIIAILLQLKQPLGNRLMAGGSSATNPDNVIRVGRGAQQTLDDNDEQQMREMASSLIEKLGRECDGVKQILYKKFVKRTSYPYSLKSSEPSHKLTSLLNRVQGTPDTRKDLEALKMRRLAESKTDDLYIAPSAKASLLDPNEDKNPLMRTAMEFLDRGGRVLLLLGDSGAGKSTFNRALEQKLWGCYEDNGWIPLHINLPAIDRPYQDLIAKHLLRNDFTMSQIREMKKHSKFILICDGYDESQQTRNLYETNELTIDEEATAQWTAKMVISCRSEYLPINYLDLFQPPPRKRSNAPSIVCGDAQRAEALVAHNAPAANSAPAGSNAPVATDVTDFKEVEIAPFTKDKIKEYVGKWVRKVSFASFAAAEWRAEEYMKALQTVPNLMDLVKNPFLLKLSLEVLPRVVDVHRMQEDLSRTSITRVRLYDHFMEHWLEREKKRVRGKELSQQDKVAFQTLVHEGFAQNGINFLKRLAGAIYKEQSGHPVVEYLRFRDEKTWKAAFFKREDERHLLREACPLVRSGNQHRFIHRSLLEYCFALAVFDPHESNAFCLKLPKTLRRRPSVTSISSCEGDSTCEKDITGIQHTNVHDHPLSWKTLVSEPSILQFLVERVQQEPLFKEQLLDLIELSKKSKRACKAAANAITILVRSGHHFNGADLRGIRIRGADLSGGEFDCAQLGGADLRDVNFRNIWLRQADLRKAQMEGAKFGESPYLVHRSGVQCCVYSPDGAVCAVGLCSNEIKLHETTTWKEVHTLRGHEDMVAIVVYSPDGKQIASGSDDKTVRLWDPLLSSAICVFKGHTGRVECVVYSPKGDLIASCSSDKTVRIWNPATLQLAHLLDGHDNFVMSVVFSPSGKYVASGSYDNTVRIWSAHDGDHIRTLTQHTSCVKSVIYSPDGKHIASASYDKTVRIWDSTSGEQTQTLLHEVMVTSMAYSPNGHQIAAGSGHQVHLWDPKSGTKLHLLSGHADSITNIVYSPSGHQIASSSYDKTARLWDTQLGAPGPILSGHVNNIMGMVYAPNGHQIATASLDKTVRLWDSQTGVSVLTSSGHTDRVNSVTYSLKGRTLASGGFDKTLRHWNANTGDLIKVFGAVNQITSGDVDQTTTFEVGRIEKIAYSPIRGQIAIGSDDHCVYIWDTETGERVYKLPGHDDCVTSVAYSPEGQFVASGSDDCTVRLWDVERGESVLILYGHTGCVSDVAFSPCGMQIASGSFDKTLILWHAESGEVFKTLVGHTGIVTSVVYSPDGQWIASGSNDKTVRLWKSNGDTGVELKGHMDRVRSVVFSPSGKEIASGSLDSSVKLWEVESGQLLVTVKVFQSPCRSIAWVKNDFDKTGRDEKSLDKGSLNKNSLNKNSLEQKGLDKKGFDKNGLDKNSLDKNPIESFLAAGSDDKSVRVWSVRRIDGKPQVQLHWNSTHDRLVVTGANLENTQGLSDINMKLMEQRGAKGLSSGVVEEEQRKILATKFRMASHTVKLLKTAVERMQTAVSHKEPDISSSANASLPSPPQEEEQKEFPQVPQVAQASQQKLGEIQ
ncbi:hypothetical protein BGZ68_006209 [Mortierella alpina]|nr:hypothetical protein BGZ68_006209 [Mortierella alpina]